MPHITRLTRSNSAVGILLALVMLGASGCVNTQPLVSHAHIGHAMTTWHDTPKQQALLAVAEKRLREAYDAAEQGCHSSDPDLAGERLWASLHALSPEMLAQSDASTYGAIRAFSGAVEHIEYAASSQDASLNLVTSVAVLSEQAAGLTRYLATTAVTLRKQLDSGRVRCRDLLAALNTALQHDAGQWAQAGPLNTGKPRAESPPFGLLQFRTLVMAMLARETNPPYEPVSRRYVLGLVRLPTGLWDFRLGPPPRRTGIGPYGGSGVVGY